MSRRPRLCKNACGRPVRRVRGALWCSACVAKQGKRTCGECGEDFYPDMMANGLRCKGCQRKRSHGTRIQATYSITRDDYEAILAAQGGKCAICHRVLTRKNYCVDHDHSCCPGPTSCGKCVRGLICSVDNKYLGYIRDDPEAAYRAGRYLEDPPARKVLG